MLSCCVTFCHSKDSKYLKQIGPLCSCARQDRPLQLLCSSRSLRCLRASHGPGLSTDQTMVAVGDGAINESGWCINMYKPYIKVTHNIITASDWSSALRDSGLKLKLKKWYVYIHIHNVLYKYKFTCVSYIFIFYRTTYHWHWFQGATTIRTMSPNPTPGSICIYIYTYVYIYVYTYIHTYIIIYIYI